jgi:hypothetical protein
LSTPFKLSAAKGVCFRVCPLQQGATYDLIKCSSDQINGLINGSEFYVVTKSELQDEVYAADSRSNCYLVPLKLHLAEYEDWSSERLSDVAKACKVLGLKSMSQTSLEESGCRVRKVLRVDVLQVPLKCEQSVCHTAFGRGATGRAAAKHLETFRRQLNYNMDKAFLNYACKPAQLVHTYIHIYIHIHMYLPKVTSSPSNVSHKPST